MSGSSVAVLVFGVVILALSLSGRARMRRSPTFGMGDWQQRFFLVSGPLVGAAFVVAAFVPLLPDGLQAVLSVVAVVALVLALAWGPLGAPLPDVLVPPDVRALRARQKAAAKARRTRRKR